MKVHKHSEQFSRNTTHRRAWSVVGTGLAAGLAVVTLACGDDKKSASQTNPPNPSNTDTPVVTNPNATVPNTSNPVEPTTTDVDIVTDSATDKPVKKATYAVISYDGKKILGYSYDYCAWAAAHSTADAANVKPPKDGEGVQFILNIDASPGMAPTAGNPYTVDPKKTENNVTFDENIYGVLQSSKDSATPCKLTSRGPSTGSVKWFTVSDSRITGVLDVTLVGWPGSQASTKMQGGFVAQKCTPSAGTGLTYAADTDACASVTYD